MARRRSYKAEVLKHYPKAVSCKISQGYIIIEGGGSAKVIARSPFAAEARSAWREAYLNLRHPMRAGG
jgi:hypothetical protein